jgi:hypothetical protein
MGNIHRFDRSKRRRFRSDALMPQIHAMTRQSIDAAMRRKKSRPFYMDDYISGTLFVHYHFALASLRSGEE